MVLTKYVCAKCWKLVRDLFLVCETLVVWGWDVENVLEKKHCETAQITKNIHRYIGHLEAKYLLYVYVYPNMTDT